MGITDVLCKSLQQQSQYIVNVMRLICSTKGLIQNLRENGIELPNFGASYVARQGHSRHLQWSII